jgi:hypothetical protein
MTENYEEQAKQMIEKGKQATAAFIKGGEMIIDADPEKGFFRIKLRNIQPPEATSQLTAGYCLMLENFAAMCNLQVKQYVEKQGG